MEPYSIFHRAYITQFSIRSCSHHTTELGRIQIKRLQAFVELHDLYLSCLKQNRQNVESYMHTDGGATIPAIENVLFCQGSDVFIASAAFTPVPLPSCVKFPFVSATFLSFFCVLHSVLPRATLRSPPCPLVCARLCSPLCRASACDILYYFFRML